MFTIFAVRCSSSGIWYLMLQLPQAQASSVAASGFLEGRADGKAIEPFGTDSLILLTLTVPAEVTAFLFNIGEAGLGLKSSAKSLQVHTGALCSLLGCQMTDGPLILS